MSFFTLSSGSVASGDPMAAFIADMSVIPNNSMVLATLEKCEVKEFRGTKTFSVTWKMLNLFKNQIVRQKIDVFSDNEKKADRAKEMFMLIFKICNVNVQDKNHGPTPNELYQLERKVCGLRIREYSLVGDDGVTREGNFVSELHDTKGFIEAVGEKMVAKETKSRPNPTQDFDELNPPMIDDEIPF